MLKANPAHRNRGGPFSGPVWRTPNTPISLFSAEVQTTARVLPSRAVLVRQRIVPDLPYVWDVVWIAFQVLKCRLHSRLAAIRRKAPKRHRRRAIALYQTRPPTPRVYLRAQAKSLQHREATSQVTLVISGPFGFVEHRRPPKSEQSLESLP